MAILSFLLERKVGENESGVVLSSQRSLQKKKIQALFIPALLHKQARPDDFVQHYFCFPKVTLIFFGVFNLVIFHLDFLHDLSTECYRAILQLSDQFGIIFETLEAGKTAKVLVEHDFADLEMQGGNVFHGSCWRWTADHNNCRRPNSKDFKHELAIPETALPDFKGMRIQFDKIEICENILVFCFQYVCVNFMNSLLYDE